MKQVTQNDFWLEKPAMMGARGWSLLIPAMASSVGFFCFGVLGFGFTELDALSNVFRQALVLTGAFALAFGAEVGTLSSITEIYRKGERLGRWDKFALAVSVLATFSAFILAFASLLGVKATWGATVQLYGPIFLGMLAALDSYGGFMEFGLYLNSYDKRIKQWQGAFADFKKEQVQTQLDADRRLSERRLQAQLAQVDTETSKPMSILGKIDSQAGAQVDTLTQANIARARGKQERLDKMLTLYRQDAMTPVSSMAQSLQVSRQTVNSYLTELEATGTIRRNGGGVEVMQ
jgi:hypothetical protein